MSALDPARALRAAADLRALCLALPHVPTPAETVRLERFETLVSSPGSAGAGDVDALATGWREWWRSGRAADLLAMAAAVPARLVECDRRLAMLLVAAVTVCSARPADREPRPAD